jgi:hypothetical protein
VWTRARGVVIRKPGKDDYTKLKAAFASVERGRQIQAIRVKGINGDLIQWTASCLTDRTREVVSKGNVMVRQPVEAGSPQGSLVSPILFPICMSGLIKWVEERVSVAESLSFVGDLGWVVTGNDVDQVVKKLQACARVSMDWAERWQLEFDSAKLKRHSSPADEAKEALAAEENSEDKSWECLHQV